MATAYRQPDSARLQAKRSELELIGLIYEDVKACIEGTYPEGQEALDRLSVSERLVAEIEHTPRTPAKGTDEELGSCGVLGEQLVDDPSELALTWAVSGRATIVQLRATGASGSTTAARWSPPPSLLRSDPSGRDQGSQDTFPLSTTYPMKAPASMRVWARTSRGSRRWRW